METNNTSDDQFVAIFQKRRKKLLAQAYKMTKNYEAAADIVQETFFRAYRATKTDSFQPKNIYGWLYRIMCNVHINQYWKKKQHPTDRIEVFADHESSILNSLEHSTESVEEAYIKAEMLHNLEQLLNKLPPTHRDPVKMSTYDGKKYAEIAELLHISLASVKTRIHVAKKLLRKPMLTLYGPDNATVCTA